MNSSFAYIDNKPDSKNVLYLKQYPKKNKIGSCYLISDFILNILKVKPNDFSEAVKKSIIKLDNLARIIDSKIDNIYGESPFENTNNLSVDTIRGLRQKIVESLNPLMGFDEYEPLFYKTITAVNNSFKQNTTNRHLVYSLKSSELPGNSTMEYLFPLILSLLPKNKAINSNGLLVAFATYIQILDDYVDLNEDILNFAKTPISNRFWELGNSAKNFNVLSKEVIQKLNVTYRKVETELINVFPNKDIEDSIKFWRDYQFKLNKMIIPKMDNQKSISEFLKKFKSEIPPVLCYVP